MPPSFSTRAILVALIVAFGVGAVVYHHLSKEGLKNVFDPDQTDVLNYVGFRLGREHGDGESMTITWSKLLPTFSIDYELFDGADKGDAQPAVNIWDARKNPDLTFAENGFTLIDLSSSGNDIDINSKHKSRTSFEPSDWKDQDQMQHFHSTVMVSELKKLYPNATRFHIPKKGKVRGGWAKNQALVNGVHSDILIDGDSATTLHGAADNTGNNTDDRSKEVLEAIVTIWKPIGMNGPVCDKPLALLDASTYQQEDQRPYLLRVRLWPFVEKDDDLIGVPIHKPDSHKWYYYPFMTNDEVLLFSQYDRNKGFFTVPHGAFFNPNCPPGTETRVSYNYRVWVYSTLADDERQAVQQA